MREAKCNYISIIINKLFFKGIGIWIIKIM